MLAPLRPADSLISLSSWKHTCLTCVTYLCNLLCIRSTFEHILCNWYSFITIDYFRLVIVGIFMLHFPVSFLKDCSVTCWFGFLPDVFNLLTCVSTPAITWFVPPVCLCTWTLPLCLSLPDCLVTCVWRLSCLLCLTSFCEQFDCCSLAPSVFIQRI